MKLIKDQTFGGERPLFASHDVHLDNVTITAGESAIKECSNIVATNCRFEGNYPFWHVHGFTIQDCYFAVGGRSALWYSDHLVMKDTVIDAPKMFREMNDIEIENVQMNDADEIFWRCDRLNIRNLTLHDGTYPFMFSRNIYVDGLVSDSKYVFQYVKDVEIHHASLCATHTTWCWRTVPSTRHVTVPSNTARFRPTSAAPSRTSRTPHRDASWQTASVPSRWMKTSWRRRIA